MGLIELLILIAILALLVGILWALVALMRSRKGKIRIQLEKNIPEYDLEELELRELPSGGARMVQRSFEEVMRQASELENIEKAKRRPRSKVLKTDLSREAVLARRAAALAAAQEAAARGEVAAAEQIEQADPEPVEPAQAVFAAVEQFDEPAVAAETATEEFLAEEAAEEPSFEIVAETHAEPEVQPEPEQQAEPEWASVAVRADEYQPQDSYVSEDEWLDDVSPVREVKKPAAAAMTDKEESVRREPVFTEMRFDDQLGLVPADEPVADEPEDEDDFAEFQEENNESVYITSEEEIFDTNEVEEEVDAELDDEYTADYFVDSPVDLDEDDEEDEEPAPAPEPKELGDMLDELLEEKGVSPHVDYPEQEEQAVFQPKLDPEPEFEAEAVLYPEPDIEPEVIPEPVLDPEPEFEPESEFEAEQEAEQTEEPETEEAVAETEQESEQPEAALEDAEDSAEAEQQAVEPEPEAEQEPDEDEELLPEYFDSEVEAEPEPQPQPVDSFAAVDNKDDIDDLFNDEDEQRRKSALEEEPVSTSKRFMSWAGAALGKLRSRAAAQDEHSERPVEELRQPQPQQQPQYQPDPLADYSLNDERDDVPDADPLYDAPQPQHVAHEEDAVDAWQQYAEQHPQDQAGYEAYEQQYIEEPQQEEAPVAAESVSRSSVDDSPYASSMSTSMRASAASAARGNSRNLRENQLSLDMPVEEDDDKGSEFTQVMVINVMAKPGAVIYGDDLVQVLLGAGLRFGEMSIFHRHADRRGGPVLFSVANAFNPGTFDLNRISEFTTQGISFFMTLPNVANNMLAFEQMLATAKHAQQMLDGELKDDNRSVMTAQTIEHYRQRIRDFELQQIRNSRQK